ncbi:transcriptional repressor [Rhizobiales bacterium Sp-1]|uniref:Ferric uptake regulation protein n=2 Tax=Segnochrobactrum spirostomi TaxID=2608987 RepID=A0A6A7Y2D0_9HYPH|nr:transcriptional repressor [Segnochrobactrum spirostomi]
MVISRVSSVVVTDLHGIGGHEHGHHQHGHHEHHHPMTVGSVRSMLREAGLRPTRQRLALAEILYAKGNRHVSAEQLHEEALTARVPVSLATVYNTLHQFTEAGLLREVAVDGTKTYFDTNTSDHHHFFIETANSVIDIPGDGLVIGDLPAPPEDMEIVRVDVVVRVRPKQR